MNVKPLRKHTTLLWTLNTSYIGRVHEPATRLPFHRWSAHILLVSEVPASSFVNHDLRVDIMMKNEHVGFVLRRYQNPPRPRLFGQEVKTPLLSSPKHKTRKPVVKT